MNVIVSNKFQSLLQGLEIETLKNINGVFSVDEIISQFKVIFFQRMILDITAIKDYKNIENLQKLAISLDAEKIILLLDDDAESSSPAFQSKLISMGIYNFTQNLEGINYLLSHPNTYRDVAHIQQLDNVGGAFQQQQAVQTDYQRETVYIEKKGPRVIGIKNVTQQAGSTTLTYMLLKQLKKNYSAVAIELEKRDFNYFGNNDNDMFSKKGAELGNFIAENNDKDVILVDMNNAIGVEDICGDILYLIEPSTIKLNKYMLLNPKGLVPFKGKKVILNQSLLNEKDVHDFEYESKLNIFYSLPDLDERKNDIDEIDSLLQKLGFIHQEISSQENRKKGLFGR